MSSCCSSVSSAPVSAKAVGVSLVVVVVVADWMVEPSGTVSRLEWLETVSKKVVVKTRRLELMLVEMLAELTELLELVGALEDSRVG